MFWSLKFVLNITTCLHAICVANKKSIPIISKRKSYRYTSNIFLNFNLINNFVWFEEYRYKASSSSFLFSLRNKDNLAPFIANIKQGQEQNAIYCYSGYGPTFGAGHDLHICDNPQVNQQSYSNLGSTYQLLPGSEQAKNLLAGQFKFLITEIEVFNWTHSSINQDIGLNNRF